MRLARALAVVASWIGLAAFVACSLPGGDYTSAPDDAGSDSSATNGDGGTSSNDPKDADPDAPLPGTVDAAPAEGCPSAGHSCQPDAPDGWTGPLMVYDGDGSGVPSCPATMAVARINAHRGFHDPGPNTCTDCTCTTANSQTCTISLNVSNSDCSSSPTMNPAAPGKCVSAAAGTGYTITETVSGGSCPPIGGIPQAPPVEWDSTTRACGAPSLLRTGCGDGQVCAPVAQNPFRSKLCVMRSGDVDCPGDPYSTKLLTNGADDERKCAKCECNPATGGSCNGAGFGFGYPGATNCSGAFQMVTIPQPACQTSPAGGFSMMGNGASATGGSCTPVVVTPAASGSVTANNPITICCQN